MNSVSKVTKSISKATKGVNKALSLGGKKGKKIQNLFIVSPSGNSSKTKSKRKRRLY